MKGNNRVESFENPDVTFEPRDVNPRSLFFIGISILVAAVVIHFGVLLLFDYFAARDRRRGLQPSTTVRSSQVRQPPEAQLQVNPEHDLGELRQAQADKLRGYDWADQNAGTVRIPIERAMELLAQRGLPQVEQQHGTDKTSPADHSQAQQGSGQRGTTNANSGRVAKQKQP